MTEEEPKIEFPCDYPIKVIAEMGEQVVQQVLAIVSQHDEEFHHGKLTEQPSRNGTYVSLRIELRATGKPQLDALFSDLKTISEVRMVL